MSASSHFGKDRYPTGVVCSMDINKNAPSGLSSGRYDSMRHIPPSTAEMMIFLTSGFACMILFITFAPPRPKTRHREGRDFTATSRPLPTSHDGEVLEWLKRRAWKVRIPQKGIAGSNPALSATNAENQQIAKQTPSFTPKNVKSGVFVLFKIIQPLHNKRVAILKESDEKRLIFIYPFSLIFQDFTSS